MKSKSLFFLASLLTLSTPIFSNIAVTWGTQNGVFNSAQTAAIGINSVWALYWSPDNQIDSFDPFGNLSTMTGNDQLIIVANNSTAGILQSTDFGGTVNFVQPQTDGYIYSRVFESTQTVNFADPLSWDINFTDGTFFFETSPITGPVANNTTPTNFADKGGIGPGGTATLTSQLNVIPEPGTVALLVMGAFGLAMKFRRRRS